LLRFGVKPEACLIEATGLIPDFSGKMIFPNKKQEEENHAAHRESGQARLVSYSIGKGVQP